MSATIYNIKKLNNKKFGSEAHQMETVLVTQDLCFSLCTDNPGGIQIAEKA